MQNSIDLGTASAAFNLLASGGALMIMQTTTRDAGVRCGLALLKLGHRAVLAIVAIVLFANGVITLTSGTDPRPIDFMVEFVLILVLAFSGLRHRMASTPSVPARAL